MRFVVIDTNCLLQMLPKKSPYRPIWDMFLGGGVAFCVTNEILEEYAEVIADKTSPTIADNILLAMMNRKNVILVTPYYDFHLIEADVDDNKFVNCAIAANAEVIVSNDHHFDVLKTISFPHVSVKTIDAFLLELLAHVKKK